MVAVLACKLWLTYAPGDERPGAAQQLARLLPSADWILREEIESCLETARSSADTSGSTHTTLH